MRSASTTGMSNSLNRFAMVLFPVPILPVNPTFNVIFISSFHTKLLIFSVDKTGIYAYPACYFQFHDYFATITTSCFLLTVYIQLLLKHSHLAFPIYIRTNGCSTLFYRF